MGGKGVEKDIVAHLYRTVQVKYLCVDRMSGAAGDCKQFNSHSLRRWTGQGDRRPGGNVLRGCSRTARGPRRSSRRLVELLCSSRDLLDLFFYLFCIIGQIEASEFRTSQKLQSQYDICIAPLTILNGGAEQSKIMQNTIKNIIRIKRTLTT